MILTRYPFTVAQPSGVVLTPQPPKTPQGRYLAAPLPLGAVSNWSNKELTATLAAAAGSTATVAMVDGIKAVVTNGSTDRFSTANGPAWRGLSMVVKLPATTTGEDQLVGPNLASNGMVFYNSTTGLLGWRNGTAATVSIPATPGWHVITATLADTGGAATLSVDTAHAGGTISAEAIPTGLRFAGNFSSGSHAALSTAEISQWTTVPTPSEIDSFVEYARAEYAPAFP